MPIEIVAMQTTTEKIKMEHNMNSDIFEQLQGLLEKLVGPYKHHCGTYRPPCHLSSALNAMMVLPWHNHSHADGLTDIEMMWQPRQQW